jgi:hypothetical protein
VPTDEKLHALALAQVDVEMAEAAVTRATLVAITMTPRNLPDYEHNDWRSNYTAPTKQALQRAIAARNSLLQPAGFTLEAWLERWRIANQAANPAARKG